MKRKNILLFLLICIFSCIIAVQAENVPFKYDWETNKLYEPGEMGLLYATEINFNNGYIESYVDIETAIKNDTIQTEVIYYNIKGEEIAKISLKNRVILDFKTDNTYIYALALDYDYKPVIIILDNTLKVTKEIPVTLADGDYVPNDMIEYFKQYDYTILSLVDNKLYFDSMNYVYEVNLETYKVNRLSFEEENYSSIFPIDYKKESKSNEDKWFVSYDKENTKEVYSGSLRTACPSMPKEAPKTSEDVYSHSNKPSEEIQNPNNSTGNQCYTYTGVIELYDNDELILEKEYEDYTSINSAKLISDYIVAIGVRKDTTTNVYHYEIIVLDIKGNIIQKINTSEYYFNIEKGPTSFMVQTMDTAASTRCAYIPKPSSQVVTTHVPECGRVNHEVYYLPLKIETKVEGSGKVIANTTSRYGEEIIFTVQPEKGYVLGAVSVTDKNGNTVTFTDYTFTMPSADVTIEATFVKEQIVVNPETSAFAIIVAIIIAIIGGVTFINTKKKLTWLN